MALVREPFDGRVLDCPVHAQGLSVRPRVPWLCQPVFNVEIGARRFEGMAAKENLFDPHGLDILGRPAITRGIGEMGPSGEHRVDFVGDSERKGPEEVAGDAVGRLLVNFDEGELGSSVNRHQKVELAFLGSHLGDIDVEIADRVAFELGALWLVAVNVGQPRDAVALKAAMQ